MLVGILADSHGLIKKLRQGIDTLRSRNVEKIIHLGDVTDTLRLETVDECVRVLVQNDIEGVIGNHEYSLVKHHFNRYRDKFSKSTIEYVCSLPRLLEISGVCFTHFSPNDDAYGLYAQTDDASYEMTLRKSAWPVVINGHSHDPCIFRKLEGIVEGVKFDLDVPFKLDPAAKYILTCGAVEDNYCAVFDLDGRSFEVITL